MTRRRAPMLAALPALLLVAGCATWGGRPASGAAQTATATGGPVAFALPAAPGPPARLALVTVAGLTPERYLGPGGAMPVLRGLAAAGAAAERLEPVAPAAPYPAHATLVTGLPPSEHGIAADRMLGERGVRSAPLSHASQLRGVPLWQRVGEAGVPVAALDWPTTVGAAIAYLLPDAAPDQAQTWGQALATSATPMLLERLAAAGPEVARPGAARDAFLVETACALLGGPAAPRLLLVRLRGTEEALERFGPRAPEADAAFAAADAQLGRLARCLFPGEGAPEGALVVVGDRAFLPVHTAVRPNRVLADAGLLEPDGRGGIAAWRALARSNGGSAFVYAADAADAVAARRALEEAADASGAFRVVSAEEMIARRADREAWFGVEAEPGFVFADDAGGPLLTPAAARGAAGYLTGRPDLAPGFVAYGRGVRAGLTVPTLRQTDVAPTLAHLVGTPLPEALGRTLVGLLRVPGDVASSPEAAPQAPAAGSGPGWTVEVLQ